MKITIQKLLNQLEDIELLVLEDNMNKFQKETLSKVLKDLVSMIKSY